jgi:hypothetical protein
MSSSTPCMLSKIICSWIIHFSITLKLLEIVSSESVI